MDSRQRRIFAREMRRLGLSSGRDGEMPQKPKSIQTPEFALVIAFALALLSLAVAAVLAVLGVRMKNLSWLFILAWVFLVPACGAFCWYFKTRSAYILSLVVLVVCAVGLFWLNVKTQLPKEGKKENVEISWPAPSSIDSATPLSATQLNARAIVSGREVDGEYVYNPTLGV